MLHIATWCGGEDPRTIGNCIKVDSTQLKAEKGAYDVRKPELCAIVSFYEEGFVVR